MGKYDSVPLVFFDESYTYKGYALVNEIYEDDDHRSNTWIWGTLDGDSIVDGRILQGLSSNGYAAWDEVWNVFTVTVENILKKM